MIIITKAIIKAINIRNLKQRKIFFFYNRRIYNKKGGEK